MGFFSNASKVQSHPGTVEQFCRDLGWSVDERVSDSGIILHFRDPLVSIRKLLITTSSGGQVAIISALSSAGIPAQDMPREVMGYLLLRNKEAGFAAWQLAGIDNGNATFAAAYLALLQGMTAPTFKVICEGIVKEVNTFDARMKDAGLL